MRFDFEFDSSLPRRKQLKGPIKTNSDTQSRVNTLAVGLETFGSLSALYNHPVMQKIRKGGGGEEQFVCLVSL